MDETWSKTKSDFGFVSKIRNLGTLDFIIAIFKDMMEKPNKTCWNYRDLKYLTLSLIY